MDLNWARKGISDLHHLSEKIKKHESSRDHINSCTTFALLALHIEKVLFCKQIEKADYLSIQCDETTDVSNYCQMVLILRYFNERSICEHFWGFIRIKDKTATGLKTCIENEIDPLVLKTPQKLIAQTYDGANVMSGVNNGVQAQIKIKYPNAHFIHCYAHQLNLIMQKSASPVFFFKFISSLLPRAVITRWNYNIRTVNFVHENREKLTKMCLKKLKADVRKVLLQMKLPNSSIRFCHKLTYCTINCNQKIRTPCSCKKI
nr:unnamed protein product [Callosobruchus chinensis]